MSQLLTNACAGAPDFLNDDALYSEYPKSPMSSQMALKASSRIRTFLGVPAGDREYTERVN